MESLASKTKRKKEKISATEIITSSFTKDQIAFQRGMLIPAEKPANKQKRLSIQAEMMKLGYMLTKEALAEVSVEWYHDILPFIKKILGAGKFTPFYKNFPTQVMEMDECELFMNAIMHYWSEGTWEPEQELVKRGIKFENTTFKMIKLGTEKEFRNIFSTLVSINQSITENDKEVIKWFVLDYQKNKTKLVMPDKIPFKETLAMLASFELDVPVKSPTDVLRIAVYLSGGDISLPSVPKIPVTSKKKGYKIINSRMDFFFNNKIEAAIKEREAFKFKNFSRSQRRYLLSLLEKTNLDMGEMKLKVGRWIRLGEKLHPGEYKNRFPKAFSAFYKLRNDAKEIKTFHSMVDAAFAKRPVDGINILSQRPGEFARKLDWMLREFDSSLVLNKFNEISHNISRKVLWELYNHFLTRDTSTQRSIMIKGKKSKRKILEPLPPMSKILINKVQNQILKCISGHFGKMDKLGNVWIDERLKKVPLPFAMRSVNTAVKTYVRGTRVAFDNPDAKVIRPYIHWYDVHGNEDLDLSVGFYSENLQQIAHISYTDLRNTKLNCCHSGDIRQRKGSCAEYVDIDINKCLSNKVRYAIVQVHNFQQRPMHTMKDCVFGIMEREFPEANKIWSPKTISNSSQIANEGSTVVICILDLKNREYIWADLELDTRYLANIESTSNMSHQILIDLINQNKLSVYDLFMLHAESRGKIVSDVKKAKTIFAYEEFVTGYDKVASYM